MTDQSIDLLMPDNIAETFTELSLDTVWKILRQNAVGKVVGRSYCPVPFVNKAQYFDLFNVFVQSNKGLIQKLKRVTGLFGKLCYVAKIGDVLKFSTPTSKSYLAQDTSIWRDPDGQMNPHFTYRIRNADKSNEKEIFLCMKKIQNYHTNLTFDATHEVFLKRNYPELEKVKSIYVVTDVCAANELHIYASCAGKVSDWNFQAPHPVAFQLTKYEVATNGRLGKKSKLLKEDYFAIKHWLPPMLAFPPDCVALRSHIQGEAFDVTVRTCSQEMVNQM